MSISALSSFPAASSYHSAAMTQAAPVDSPNDGDADDAAKAPAATSQSAPQAAATAPGRVNILA